MILSVKKDLEELKGMNEKSALLDWRNNLKVPAEEILLYATKISNFL